MTIITTRAATKAELYAYVASKRYDVEIGGIMFNGMPVWTDRATQSMLQRVSYMLDKGMLSAPLDIKTPEGFVSMTEAHVNAIGTAVGLHVQAAFIVEVQVAAAIDAGTITTVEQIDAAPWPQALT